MSLLRDTDTLSIQLSRVIDGERVQEGIEISIEDVRYLSTPMLLRYFTEQIGRATDRLDFIEENAPAKPKQ